MAHYTTAKSSSSERQCRKMRQQNKKKIWTVMHIMAVGKAEEHPHTKPARVEDHHLVYTSKK